MSPFPAIPGIPARAVPPVATGATGAVVPDGTQRALTVRRRERLAAGVVGLELADPAGADLPEWAAGAHVDVTVGPGIVRQYSLCGDPRDRSAWRIAVLREPTGRGGSIRLHDRVEAGAVLRVGEPRNAFPLVAAERYLLIAGGIGITPLLPMATELAARGAPWRLLYGGRTRSCMAFVDELAGHGDRVVLYPQDSHGLLPLADALGQARHPGTAVYCCGPRGLIEAVEQIHAGWPEGTLHIERFHPAVAAHQAGDGAFEVVLAASGRSVRVGPGVSVLAALEEAGLAVTSSCRDGTCGTCETRVLGGAVDHRDTVLSEAERAAGASMMVCVSRAATNQLVLDL